jgi:hypothetical protein
MLPIVNYYFVELSVARVFGIESLYSNFDSSKEALKFLGNFSQTHLLFMELLPMLKCLEFMNPLVQLGEIVTQREST